MSEPQNDISYQLGMISAQLVSIAADVRETQEAAIRTSAQVVALGQEVSGIQAERKRMVQDYDKFVHRVNNHMTNDIAWKSLNEGRVDGALKTANAMRLIIGVIAAAVLYVGWQVEFHPASHAAPVATASAAQG